MKAYVFLKGLYLIASPVSVDWLVLPTNCDPSVSVGNETGKLEEAPLQQSSSASKHF